MVTTTGLLDQSSHLLVDVTTAGVEGVVYFVVETIGDDQSAHLLLSTTGVVVDLMTTGVVDVMTTGIDGVVDGFQSDQTVEVCGMGTGVVLVMIGMLEVVHGVVSPPPWGQSPHPLPPPGP